MIRIHLYLPLALGLAAIGWATTGLAVGMENSDGHPNVCRASLLDPPDASGSSCHGPWAYHHFPCYRASRDRSCGVESFETERVTANGRCRHPDFGIERWEVVARAPLPGIYFPAWGADGIDQAGLERDARAKAGSLAHLLSRDGARLKVEVVQGQREYGREQYKPRFTWPRAEEFDETLEWLRLMSNDAWQQGFHYNKGREKLENFHAGYHYHHKGNIENRIRWLSHRIQNDCHYFADEEHFDLVISTPVYSEREDVRCGTATLERPSSTPRQYRECRHQGAGPELSNICSVPASTIYGVVGEAKERLSADHSPWWDRDQGGAWCTTCDYVVHPAEKVRCLFGQLARSTVDNRPPEEMVDLVRRAKLAFELAGSAEDDERRLLPFEQARSLALAQEYPWEDHCGSSLRTLDTTPDGLRNLDGVRTLGLLSFCHRLRLSHAAPPYAERYLEWCGSVASQASQRQRYVDNERDSEIFLTALINDIAARAALPRRY